MGDSPSSDDTGQSDEQIEARERAVDQVTGNFGGFNTNVGNPQDSGGFAGDTPQQQAVSAAVYARQQRDVGDKARRGEIEGINLQPSTQDVQDFAREQSFFDNNPMSTVVDAPFTSRSADINVGPGDIFGLREQIGKKLSQGGTAVTNNMGQIVGATGQTPMFGIPFLPDVTTYTGRNEYNPFGDPTIGGDDDGNESNIIRARMSGTEPVDEPDDSKPPVTDELASDYLQNPFYLYSGQNNLYQPYGYAANTLVNLLRTRNMTQPQQAAANLGLFGNPGDFS